MKHITADKHLQTLREIERRVHRRIESRRTAVPAKPVHVEVREIAALRWAIEEIGRIERMRDEIRRLHPREDER